MTNTSRRTVSPPGIRRGDAVLAFVAVAALAINLRTAPSSVAPIVTWIDVDIPLSPTTLGLLGMLPPIMFALAGLVLAPWIAPRGAGLAAGALVLAMAGSALRAVGGDLVTLAAGGALALLGMGIGNVLLPALVKRHLPHRIGAATALYTSLLGVSAMLPPLVEPVVAAEAGWRLAMGLWAVLPVACLTPVVLLAVRGGARSETRRDACRMPRWRPDARACALAGLFGVSSTIGYTSFAWIPVMVREQFGVDEVQAALMLSLFAGLGIPVALAVPWLVAPRIRLSGPVAILAAGSAVVGYALLTAGMPAGVPLVGVTLVGLGQGLFSLCLTLVGVLGRDPAETARLSGFMQGVGYLAAAALAFALGALRSLSGGWILGGGMMVLVCGLGVVSGWALARILRRAL
ncbi:CynX/NimT family MFS transporter [Microbacterium sp.]|uniref:MFS transporter n=1 Tax=Microbacterium sp. TaxID=51671 RepID=UPI0039E2E037